MASKNNTPAAAGADDVVLAVVDDGFRQMKGLGATEHSSRIRLWPVQASPCP